jgi:hypothetical protein
LVEEYFGVTVTGCLDDRKAVDDVLTDAGG